MELSNTLLTEDESYLSTDSEDLRNYRECWRHKISHTFHHTTRPAIIYDDCTEQWMEHGIYSRKGNLPSYTGYHQSGAVRLHIYEYNHKRHRTNGPALEQFSEQDGTLIRADFWIHGIHYDNELEYWIAVEKYKKEYTNE